VFAFVGLLDRTYHHSSRMSFADIRAKRQVKEAKSLVVSSSPSGSKPSSAEAPSEPLFGTLPSSTDIQTGPERGRGIYAKESFKKGEVGHHLTTSHTHLRAQVEPFSAPSQPSMSSLPKTWSISVRLVSLLLRPRVSSAAHNVRMYFIAMRCAFSSPCYVMVICCIELEAHHRLAKTMIGQSTRKSVLRCSDGRRALHRPTSLFPQSR
jgi:hypothetical protein